MHLAKSILEDIREYVGLASDSVDFDSELIMYINGSVVELNQIGVGRNIVVKDDTTTWGDLQDPLQTEGNKVFHLVPLYIAMGAKLIFDPPPPSAVQTYTSRVDQMLWRLKFAYEESYTGEVIVNETR